jgi:hypothetical protein
MARTVYTPPGDAAQLFARYRKALETERELRAPVREMAARELRSGASVGQLAEQTGMTPEVFRRLAREIGVERKRPPTVGKLRQEQSET